MSGTASTESLVHQRRDAILSTMSRTEAAPGFALFAVLVVAYTMLHLVTGENSNSTYTLIDGLQVVVFAFTALQLHRKWVPDRLVPLAIMAAVIVGVAGQTYDYSIDRERWAILIIVTMSGTVVLHWKTFWIGSIFTFAIPSIAYYRYDPGHATTWILGTLVAVFAAANALRSRRRSALDLARAESAIEQLATVDPLTGLLNRRGFQHEMHYVRAVARRLKLPVFAVFVDVGGLKRMNDEYGHAAGDALLTSVARALGRSARETDLACRWGGDEFLLVGVGVRPDPAAVNRRLLTALDLSALPADWEPVLWVGAAQSLDHDEQIEEVIVRADHDLYQMRARDPLGSRR